MNTNVLFASCLTIFCGVCQFVFLQFGWTMGGRVTSLLCFCFFFIILQEGHPSIMMLLFLLSLPPLFPSFFLLDGVMIHVAATPVLHRLCNKSFGTGHAKEHFCGEQHFRPCHATEPSNVVRTVDESGPCLDTRHVFSEIQFYFSKFSPGHW